MKMISKKVIKSTACLYLFFLTLSALSPVPAHAQSLWTAYNDCHTIPPVDPTSQANVTDYTIYSSRMDNTTGLLRNFETGSTDGMPTVTFTMVGTLGSSGSGSAAADPAPGTDARAVFYDEQDDVIVRFFGNIVDSQSSPGWAQIIEFTGLDPTKTYTFVGTAIRATNYPLRHTRVTISGHESAVNNSSAPLGANPEYDFAVFQPANNSSTGYVVRWDEIAPGPDGIFTITSEDAGGDTEYKSYPVNGFMLRAYDTFGNTPPQVDAGIDHEITQPVHTVNLDATVTDDGVGDPNGFLAVQWSKISGPGAVSF